MLPSPKIRLLWSFFLGIAHKPGLEENEKPLPSHSVSTRLGPEIFGETWWVWFFSLKGRGCCFFSLRFSIHSGLNVGIIHRKMTNISIFDYLIEWISCYQDLWRGGTYDFGTKSRLDHLVTSAGFLPGFQEISISAELGPRGIFAADWIDRQNLANTSWKNLNLLSEVMNAMCFNHPIWCVLLSMV